MMFFLLYMNGYDDPAESPMSCCCLVYTGRERGGKTMEEESMVADATVCAHAGQQHGKNDAGIESRGRALWQSSVYEFNSVAEFQGADFYYRRYGSPNVRDLGAAVAALEGAEAGLATSSGMGAILASLLAVCKHGDTVVASRDAYGGTYDLFIKDLHRFGINLRFEDVQEVTTLDSVLSELSSKDSATGRVIVYVETISNPLIKLVDVGATAKVCKKHNCLLIVDNTFGTPLRSKPLKQGADMVVHSATKFLGGHNDAMAGAVVGSSQLINSAAGLVARWGLAAAPFDAWLVLRGIKTLEVRVQRSWQTAAALAERLSTYTLPMKIFWAEECSMLAFEVPGGFGGVEAALRAFRMIKLSPSLGGTSTTVSHSASSSHRALPVEERNSLGITDGLLRMSVGLEHVEDIWEDLERGLVAAASSSNHVNVD